LAAALIAAALGPCSVAAGQPVSPPPTDLDAFMARVLERRDENWRRSHDYVLDEQERVLVSGPGGLRIYGQSREFTWYIRDGYFVRSPVEYNGVALADEARRGYEQRWLERERRRDREEQEKGPGQAVEGPGRGDTAVDPADVTSLVREGAEPRFVSEAYFLKFRFEPGNYYLAGRETLDGRSVLRIEYYPQRLFSEGDSVTVDAGGDVPPDRARPGANERQPAKDEKRRRKSGDEYDVDERDLNRRMNKVSLVTLWVDPAEHQIVKFTFDNVGLGFLPGQWLVRVGETSATMTMGRVLDGAWLPREITMHVDVTLANGTFEATFLRRFTNYRRAETSAKIRGYRPVER
jgi:hypothetical protein